MVIKILSLMLLVSMPLSLLANEDATFVAYCLTLEAEFFLPPDRGYIIEHGKKVEFKSQAVSALFGLLQKMKSTKATDDDMGRLRVLIMRKGDNVELLITSERKVISSGKLYEIDQKVVANVLSEIGCK